MGLTLKARRYVRGWRDAGSSSRSGGRSRSSGGSCSRGRSGGGRSAGGSGRSARSTRGTGSAGSAGSAGGTGSAGSAGGARGGRVFFRLRIEEAALGAIDAGDDFRTAFAAGYLLKHITYVSWSKTHFDSLPSEQSIRPMGMDTMALAIELDCIIHALQKCKGTMREKRSS